MTLLVVCLLLALAALVLAFVVGGLRKERRQVEESERAKDEQLQVAADRPQSRDELADRVRKDGF